MQYNNYLITITELNQFGYVPIGDVPNDSNKIVSKQTATTYYYIPYAEPFNSYTNDRCPRYQDFPISCYCYITVTNTLEGNPDPAPITYQDCSGNFYNSSVPFGQTWVLNACYYVSGDSGPLTGCGVQVNSVYAPGCEITYSTRRNVSQVCTTTTSTTSTTTTIPPDYCLIVAGYADGTDINASYNFEVCFDWYDCNLNLITYCTGSEGGFSLPYDCYQADYGYEAYYYPYPGGPKTSACCSYLAGYTPCSGTTTTTTTTPPCGVPSLPVTVYSINRYVYPSLYSGAYPYKSLDGGKTWTILPCVSSLPSISFETIATSNNGTYMLLKGKDPITETVSRYMYRSTDGGATLSTGRDIYQELTGNQGGISTIAVSGNGQYMAMFAAKVGSGPFALKLIVSSDYGANWTIKWSVDNEGGTTYVPRQIAISNDGQYITGLIYGNGYITSYIKSKRIYSSNYGGSFALSGASNLQEFRDIRFSSSGQYQVIVSSYNGNEGRVLLSTNYGADWSEKVHMMSYELDTVAITDNGSNIFAIGSTGGYTFSKNYGSTFESHFFPGVSLGEFSMSSTLIGSDPFVTLYIPTLTNYPPTQIGYFSTTGGSTWCGAYINSIVINTQTRGNS
jgi:hypothetical protein